MECRKFGATGLTPSILGFGMMRMKKNQEGNYDEDWSVKTLRYAIDNGLSYVDTAYAYGDFHNRLMRGRLTLVGCPKLDGVDYAEKLAAIFGQNDIRKVTVARMSVPCCGGLEYAVRRAVEASGKQLPIEVVTITADGQLLG